MLNSDFDPRLCPWIPIAPVPAPDPTIAPSLKDEKYCNDKARFHMSRVNNVRMDWFRLQYGVNSSFSRGAWGIDEDYLTYLKDGTKSTTRKELSIPLFHPMVMRFVGQASSVAISAKATAVTQYVKVRKETEMNLAVARAQGAQQGSYVEDAVMSTTGVGTDERDAEWTAETTYQDKYEKTASSMMTMQEVFNDYTYLKNSNANVIACSGLFAAHCVKDGMRMKWEVCHPYDVAWDTTSLRGDFADGEFAMHFPLMNISTLAARYPVKKDLIESLNQMANTFVTSSSNGWPQGKPRVATVYWKEPNYVKQGYVMTDNGLRLVAIDEKDPDTGVVRYTEKDCVELDQIPKNRYTKSWKKKVQMGFLEQNYYCTFIPWEYTPYATKQAANSYEQGKSMDVVLAYGLCDFQEPMYNNPHKVGLPLKFSTVELIDGYVVAPMTSAISPQRVANQVTSDLVWRLSKSGNQSTWVDSRALAGSDMSIEEITYAQKEGNTIEIDATAAGGMNNAIGKTDTSPSTGFYNLWGVLPQLQGMAQMGTGISDATQGQSQGAGQLVGTTELLLQQSNTMMQPFVQCITHAFRQMHQFDVQAGKMFYSQYPWALAEMVGDEGVEVFIQSKEMALEQFRADVEITVNSTQIKAATDKWLLELYQLQVLDLDTVGNLGGRSYPSDVWPALRTLNAQKAKAAQQQAQDQQKQMAAQAIAQQKQDLQRRTDETYGQAFELMGKAMGADQKASMPFASRRAEAAIPVPSEQQPQ